MKFLYNHLNVELNLGMGKKKNEENNKMKLIVFNAINKYPLSYSICRTLKTVNLMNLIFS